MSSTSSSAAAGGIISEAARLEALRNVCTKYSIKKGNVSKLRKLEGIELVLLLDDSGSMHHKMNDGGKEVTRWDVLRQLASIACEVGTALEPKGVDVHFLNRAPVLGVHDAELLNATFSKEAYGDTPLTEKLNELLTHYKAAIAEHRLLIVIATDGKPNGGHEAFTAAAKARPKNVFLSLIACTDDKAAVEYLDELDGEEGCNVSEAYVAERDEIQGIHGKDFAFSFGDYVCKLLLGSIDHETHDLTRDPKEDKE